MLAAVDYGSEHLDCGLEWVGADLVNETVGECFITVYPKVGAGPLGLDLRLLEALGGRIGIGVQASVSEDIEEALLHSLDPLHSVFHLGGLTLRTEGGLVQHQPCLCSHDSLVTGLK